MILIKLIASEDVNSVWLNSGPVLLARYMKIIGNLCDQKIEDGN